MMPTWQRVGVATSVGVLLVAIMLYRVASDLMIFVFAAVVVALVWAAIVGSRLLWAALRTEK